MTTRFALMAELPTAVLTRIFRFQSVFELKYGSMLVCTQWKDAASDPVLWKDADLLISSSAIECLDLDSWVRSLIQKGIRRYSFHKYCSRQLIVRFCRIVGSKMKRLSICGCNNLTVTDIIDIFTNSPNIESLDVSSCSVFADFSNHLQSLNQRVSDFLPELQWINLGHTNIKQVAQYPLQFLRGLEPLVLQHLGLSGIAFNSLDMERKLLDIFSHFCNLSSLDLSFTDLSEPFLRNLGNKAIPNLDEINFTGCVNLTTQVLEAVAMRHSHLKNIIIKQTNNLTYNDMLLIISKSSIKLNKLEFCDNGLLHSSDKSLNLSKKSMKFVFATVCSVLKELILSNCQLTDVFVLQLCKSVNGGIIEVLQIASCGISDTSLIEICKSLLNLKKFDISRNYKITDSGLLGQTIGEDSSSDGCTANSKLLSGVTTETNGLSNLVKLEDLSLMHLSRITDRSLEMLSHLKSLKSFSIRGCRQINGRALEDLSNQIINLQNLDIGKVPVDDGTVDCLTYNMHFLRRLNISYSEVTDKVMKIIEVNCQCLRFLDICGCEHITETRIREFIHGFGRRLFEFNSSANVVFELASF